MTDDHARWASSVYGNHELKTPTLQYLADRGAVMNAAYTPTPVCSPSRASFFTGRTASQHGIHDWIDEAGPGRDHPGVKGQTTIAQLLQNGGYHTGLVGKWHCGGSNRMQPGFDRWFSYAASRPHFGPTTYNDQGRMITRNGHQATVLTDRAIRFLRERPADQPFFLFCGYVCTHTPHANQPERLVSGYRKASFTDIPTHEKPPAGYRPKGGSQKTSSSDEARRREALAQYYAAVAMVDEQTGRVVDELDNLGLGDDTLVVYVSDHGHMNGHHGLHTKGNATIPQNLLDESIQVPLLLRWPGKIAPGTKCEAFVDHCDLFATLLEGSGISVDAETREEIHTPGRSFLPILENRFLPWRDAQFCEYANARMIRTGRYKYIQREPGPNGHYGNELYDLLNDPRETRNVIGESVHALQVVDLRRRLERHYAQYQVVGRTGAEVVYQSPTNLAHPWVCMPLKA